MCLSCQQDHDRGDSGLVEITIVSEVGNKQETTPSFEGERGQGWGRDSCPGSSVCLRTEMEGHLPSARRVRQLSSGTPVLRHWFDFRENQKPVG